MSIPHSAYDPRRVFRFNVPHFEIGPKARSVGTYLSGGLVCYSLSYSACNHRLFRLHISLLLLTLTTSIPSTTPSYSDMSVFHHKCLVIFLHCHWIRSSHCHISSCSTPLPSHPTRNRLQTRPTMSYQSTWRLSTGSLPSAPPVRPGPPIFSSPLLCVPTPSSPV